MTPAQLAAIKAGDYVWVGNSSQPHTTLKIVERITDRKPNDFTGR